MSVSLEPIVPQAEPTVVEETEEAIEEPPAPLEEPLAPPEEPLAPEIIEQPAVAPAPKKRGRPKKDPAAKAPAPNQAVRVKPPRPVPPESSGDDEPLDRDDMETLLLDDSIKRKQLQQDARRNMWAQLVGLR